jgi:hypothetical protein
LKKIKKVNFHASDLRNPGNVDILAKVFVIVVLLEQKRNHHIIATDKISSLTK